MVAQVIHGRLHQVFDYGVPTYRAAVKRVVTDGEFALVTSRQDHPAIFARQRHQGLKTAAFIGNV